MNDAKWEKAIETLAKSVAVQSIDEMCFMSYPEAEEWIQKCMDEHNAICWYSCFVYGSSQGPQMGRMVCQDTQVDESDDCCECDQLEERVGTLSQANLGSDWDVYAITDDNCIYVIAIPICV